MIKWIIFDCDGTMIDSRGIIKLLMRGYHRCYPEREPKPYEFFVPCFAMTDSKMMDYMQIEKEHRENFIRKYGLNKDEKIESYFVIFKGMKELLQELIRRGYRLGINTSRTKNLLESTKNQLEEIYDQFEIKMSSDQVSHPKPHPESLEKCIELAQCDKSEILYVGDTEADYLCAKQAGISFVLAAWGLVGEDKIECQEKCYNYQQLLDYLEKNK